jgi:hypothetical protein
LKILQDNNNKTRKTEILIKNKYAASVDKLKFKKKVTHQVWKNIPEPRGHPPPL